ncbi:hypothetical protein C5C57_05510 [Rathayibacter sp. AY1C5]|nr:hypothetical protein C5C57_05510 [Rathayibacter sp. AY1C5]
MGKVLGGAVVALGAAGAAAAGAGAVIGFKFNSSVEQASAKLNAFMKDGDKVAATLEWVKKEASETQFSFTEMADAAANLTPVAKTSGQSLESLVKQAEILAALNPTEGLTGATFSLREALSGDWVSIVDRFNLPRQRINELKAQGVPAMEIISRTLNEMGIDYSLVSAQGKTAAARFDQIKDKLTMLAGTATKPIFDLVSQGLDKINEFDATAWGDRLAAGVQNAIGALKLLTSGDFKASDWMPGIQEDSAIVDTILRIRETVIAALDYIRPAWEALSKVVADEVLPAFKRLMTEAIGPLAGSLGKILVVAIKAAIGIIAFLLSALANITTFFLDLPKNIAAGIEGFKGMMADLWTSMVQGVENAISQVGQFFDGLPAAIAFGLGAAAGYVYLFATETVPAAVNAAVAWFAQLPERIGQFASDAVGRVVSWFTSMPQRTSDGLASFWPQVGAAFDGFKNSAVAWAQDTVAEIVRAFADLPGQISKKFESAVNGAKGFLSDAGANIANGFNSVVNAKHALGTNYAPGGTTLVGEHGPELVNMPAGSQVTPAWKTASQDASGAAGGSSLTINGNVILQTAGAVDAFFKQQDQAQRFARMGMGAPA